ncbi:hypothetical protein M3Y99_00208500 [Aphelenchoides fujianensis]|nr:hypothetical protein M3Y99_00208500 [Aphelenchoides fujianensis]
MLAIEEPTPYMTEVAVAPDKITLGDFKQVLSRSNFKFYCMALDSTVGTDVKNEIRDDDHRLQKSSNGHFELFLLTAEGSSHSDPTSSAYTKPHRHGGLPPTSAGNYRSGHFPRHKNSFPLYHDSGLAQRRFLDDSTVYTESELRYSDDESRVSTSTDNVTSVSRQPHNYYRRKQQRRFRRQPSRASTVSSMTETSMSLQVICVRLNMDTVNFLGISIVGQSSARGDNGIYVGHIMAGGAVALDGRIEVGDMILEVNDTSFEKLTNDEAVAFLKEAVNKRGPIKLTVAKSFENRFAPPSREPTRPIDTRAWVQHTNAMIGLPMNSIPEGSEGAPTPIPGQFPPLSGATYVRPQSSSTATSNGSGGQNTVVSGGQLFFPFGTRFNLSTDRRLVAKAMAFPNSGLEVRNRTWLKIPVPMSFLGSALIDWLIEHVEGVRDRKDARKYAADLLRDRLIAHVVNKSSFSEQTYYVFGEECAEVLRLRNEDGSARTDLQPDLRPSLPMQPPPMGTNGGHRPFNWSNHSGEYASMPPFLPNAPHLFGTPLAGTSAGGLQNHGLPLGLDGGRHPDLHSQVSSNEGSSSSDQRKKPPICVIPPAPHGLNPRHDVPTEILALKGERTSGNSIRTQNVLACAAIANMQKLHPTTVINGYRLACKEAVRYMQDNLSFSVEELDRNSLLRAAKTSMSSKLIGSDDEFFADLCVNAAQLVKVTDANGKVTYPISAINILKCHGKEMDITKRRIEKILKAGANVVLTTGGIDDLCLKQFTEANAMAVRRCRKIDLKRIAKACGATLLGVAEFANALLVIPKTLSANAAKDATNLVAKLRAFHSRSQQDKGMEHLKWAGLDLENGEILDNKEAGVLEPLVSKIKSLKFATEAAITILRIDDLIKLEKQQPRQQGDEWYDPKVPDGTSLAGAFGMDTRYYGNTTIKGDQPGDLFDFKKKVMQGSAQYKQIAEKFDLSPEHPGIDVSPTMSSLQYAPWRNLGIGWFLPSSTVHQWGPRFFDKPMNEGCFEKGLALAKRGLHSEPTKEQKQFIIRQIAGRYLRNLPYPATLAFGYGMAICTSAVIRHKDDVYNPFYAALFTGALTASIKNVATGVTYAMALAFVRHPRVSRFGIQGGVQNPMFGSGFWAGPQVYKMMSSTSTGMSVNERRHRFPFSVVWTPIPIISWLLPFVGHMGICTSRGVIRDFAGSYYVSEDQMGFGWPTCYLQLDPEKVDGGAQAWDNAVAEASEEYKHHMHNLFCDNCHSHTALALNLMRYNGKTNWNMFTLCFLTFFKGKRLGEEMVRLSVETINDSYQFINAVRQREINLRNLQIPAIENLGTTKDQFDVIDLTDNNIRKVDNLPLLPRLDTLLLHNNRIQQLQKDIGQQLPNLRTLALTNNNIAELGDIEPLSKCTKLEYLTLVGNPISNKPHYRAYVIYKLKSLRVLDFRRIKDVERKAAIKLFKGKKGQELKDQLVKTSQLTGGDDDRALTVHGRTAAELEKIQGECISFFFSSTNARLQNAIKNAKTLAEIEQLQSLLQSGRIPDGPNGAANGETENQAPAGVNGHAENQQRDGSDGRWLKPRIPHAMSQETSTRSDGDKADESKMDTGEVEITFKTISSQTFKFNLPLSTTVGGIKQKIFEEKGDEFEVDRQKLIYNGKVLEDGQTLQELNVDTKKYIVVMAPKKRVEVPVVPKAEEGAKSEQPPTSQPASSAAPTGTTTTSTTAEAGAAPADQAAQDELPAEHEAACASIVSMGYPRGEVIRALRAAFYNADRAVEYLCTGIPELNLNAGEAAAAGEDAEMSPADSADSVGLGFLRDSPQFAQICQLVRGRPELLPQVLAEISSSNPELMHFDSREPGGMLNEGTGEEAGGAVGGGAQQAAEGGEQEGAHQAGMMTIAITENDRNAIQRLQSMGFPEQLVIEAYFACDKNEDLAVNYILARMDEAQ